MNKLITMFFIFSIYSYASLIGSNFSQRDLQVLEDLDIKSSFITDYKLQEVYGKFQNRRNSHTYISNLNEASLFVPRVKDILRQEGIPDVFIYMAMAESNFDIDARSHVQATGLWQFMDITARKYDLKLDKYVDERMDLVKSTVAAAKYLNALHERFDKWYLAAISYNCGEGRVIEAITRATIDLYVEQNPSKKNSEKIKKFRKTIKEYQERKAPFFKLGKIYNEVSKWSIKPDIDDLLREQKGVDRQYIPRESRMYIRKIISLAMMNSLNTIRTNKNSHLLNIGISNTIATVPVRGGTHLKNIAKTIGMGYEDLYSLNKHLKKSIVPPTEKYYTINIPYSRLTRYNENRDSIQSNLSGKTNLFEKKSTKRYNRKHTVKSGESLYSIAKKYKVQIKKLMKDNNLKNNFLKIGDRLVIR